MNDLFQQYLAKNQFRTAIPRPPVQPPHIIVVIPCYNEPDLLQSLCSLYACRRAKHFTEVIVVINHPVTVSGETRRQHVATLAEARGWMAAHNDSQLHFHAMYVSDVPEKIAGVGHARKTGMDEAVYRFARSGVRDGVIVGFDADSVCDGNYLEAIEQAFFHHRHINGASIYYEHPLGGHTHDARIYEGAMRYELHLRYLNRALRYAGFPHAYHTVGSAFAVSAAAYVRQGGMNRRKAGEDFHFLHKIIPLGDYIEINTTRVVPSPRASDRVPFGTGASIRQWMDGVPDALYTYPLEPFDDLKQLFGYVPHFYGMPPQKIASCIHLFSPCMQAFLDQHNCIHHIAQANANSASCSTFVKRFFAWFDGLKTVKYLNDSCRHACKRQPSDVAAAHLLQKMGCAPARTARELLQMYRNLERQCPPQ